MERPKSVIFSELTLLCWSQRHLKALQISQRHIVLSIIHNADNGIYVYSCFPGFEIFNNKLLEAGKSSQTRVPEIENIFAIVSCFKMSYL